MVGTWDVKVSIGSMPEKVATAVGELNNQFGCEYEPIAYLGSQQVNGTNHAVLVKQTVILGKDVENINLVKFHETKDGIAVMSNETVVPGGTGLGAIIIDVQTEIPEDAKNVFDDVFDGWTGTKIEPFALLATQVVKGTNFTVAATMTSVTAEPKTKVGLLTYNAITGKKYFADLFEDKRQASFRTPLGEWP